MTRKDSSDYGVEDSLSLDTGNGEQPEVTEMTILRLLAGSVVGAALIAYIVYFFYSLPIGGK